MARATLTLLVALAALVGVAPAAAQTFDPWEHMDVRHVPGGMTNGEKMRHMMDTVGHVPRDARFLTAQGTWVPWNQVNPAVLTAEEHLRYKEQARIQAQVKALWTNNTPHNKKIRAALFKAFLKSRVFTPGMAWSVAGSIALNGYLKAIRLLWPDGDSDFDAERFNLGADGTFTGFDEILHRITVARNITCPHASVCPSEYGFTSGQYSIALCEGFWNNSTHNRYTYAPSGGDAYDQRCRAAMAGTGLTERLNGSGTLARRGTLTSAYEAMGYGLTDAHPLAAGHGKTITSHTPSDPSVTNTWTDARTSIVNDNDVTTTNNTRIFITNIFDPDYDPDEALGLVTLFEPAVGELPSEYIARLRAAGLTGDVAVTEAAAGSEDETRGAGAVIRVRVTEGDPVTHQAGAWPSPAPRVTPETTLRLVANPSSLAADCPCPVPAVVLPTVEGVCDKFPFGFFCWFGEQFEALFLAPAVAPVITVTHGALIAGPFEIPQNTFAFTLDFSLLPGPFQTFIGVIRVALSFLVWFVGLYFLGMRLMGARGGVAPAGGTGDGDD